MLAALRVATGTSRWEAVGILAQSAGVGEVQSLWERYARRISRPKTLFKTLDEVARHAPTVANDWLNAWLARGKLEGNLTLSNREWITSLPRGLWVGGYLYLDQFHLPSLPEGLRVGDVLWLDRSRIKALPAGLEVGSYLFLRNCPAWDGQIPQDTRVKLFVFTTRHPNGLYLADWRCRYPHGEILQKPVSASGNQGGAT